jgi:hypothetical protein
MVVTPVGILMLLKDEQPVNALNPISRKPAGSVTLWMYGHI